MQSSQKRAGKTIRFVIDPDEIEEAVTVELVLRRRSQEQGQFPARGDEAASQARESPSVPLDPPAGQERLSVEQRKVIAVLEEAGKPLKVAAILESAGLEEQYEAAARMIHRLARAGWIRKAGFGHYQARVPQARP